jgi:hypothetical protein
LSAFRRSRAISRNLAQISASALLRCAIGALGGGTRDVRFQFDRS